MKQICILLIMVSAVSCTSADVAIRKPQEVQTLAVKGSAPVAPQHVAPVIPERGTVLGVPMPRPGPTTVTPTRPATPPGPVPVTSCDPGGCWVGGTRYHGGANNTYLDKNGRLCQTNGNWMQCF